MSKLLSKDASSNLQDDGNTAEFSSSLLDTDVLANSLASDKVMEAIIEDIKSKIRI